MNLFFNSIQSEAQYRVFTRLREHYNIERAYAVSFKEAEHLLHKDKDNMFFARYDMVYARYKGYAYFDEAPPIDENLLKSMHRYESTVMKMLECVITNDEVPDYETRVRMYHSHLRYWNYVLDKAKINIAAFTNIPHQPYSYIVYCLCKIKGIPVAIAHFGPIPGFRHFMHDISKPCPEVLESYKRLAEELKDISIDDIEILQQELNDAFYIFSKSKSRENPHRTALTTRIKDTESNSFISVLNEKKEYLSTRIREQGISQIFSVGYSWVLKKVKKIKRKDLFKIYDSLSTLADFSTQYIFFPLQYQPECTTCPMGGYFVHQYMAVRMLSFYLPEPFRIYVKEHPLQETNPRGRDAQMYYDLIELPNVQLVDRKISTDKMIENCLAVATITGSPGFEGLLREKPFLMFGNQINMYAPGTFNIRNNEECKNAIDSVIKSGAKHNLRDMKIYIRALSEVAVRCELEEYDKLFTSSTEIPSQDETTKRIVDGLVRVFNEQQVK